VPNWRVNLLWWNFIIYGDELHGLEAKPDVLIGVTSMFGLQVTFRFFCWLDNWMVNWPRLLFVEELESTMSWLWSCAALLLCKAMVMEALTISCGCFFVILVVVWVQASGILYLNKAYTRLWVSCSRWDFVAWYQLRGEWAQWVGWKMGF
jgi:hypothetical protein